MFKKSKGFTLMELLVVIAIIAILVVLIIAGLSAARAKSRDTRRKSDLRSVQTGLANYYSDNQSYPNVTTYTDVIALKSLSKTYAKEMGFDSGLPHDPKCPYTYKVGEAELSGYGSGCWGASHWRDYGYTRGTVGTEADLSGYVLGALLEKVDAPGKVPTECGTGSVYSYCIGQYLDGIIKKPHY